MDSDKMNWFYLQPNNRIFIGLLTLSLYVHAEGRDDYAAQDNNLIRIYNSGMKKFNSSDVAYVFFVTTGNIGTKTVTVGLEMEKCCQLVRPNDLECESIELINGLHVQLYPGEKRNLTMLYTNWYLLDRSGYCTIKTRYHPSDNPEKSYDGQVVKIEFDTTLPGLSIVHMITNLFTQSDLSTKCDYPDQDPRRNCKPVNCIVKYNGYRSFYNNTSFQCEPTPECNDPNSVNSKSMDFKPTVMLSPISNKCMKIKSNIEYDPAVRIPIPTAENPLQGLTSFPLKVDCIYGIQHSDNGGFINCTCDAGWSSLPINNKTFNPLMDKMVLCNTRTNNGQHNDQVHTASTLFLVLLVVAVILIVLICICIPYICRKFAKKSGYDALEEEETPAEDENKSIISCIRNRREVILPPFGPIPTKSEILKSQAEKSKQQSCLPTCAPSIQRPKPMFLRFNDDLINCNKPLHPQKDTSCQSYFEEICGSMNQRNYQHSGTCMTIQQPVSRMGSTCDCCDNSLLEPVLKINILPSVDHEEPCCSRCTNGNNTNIEITSQGIYLPESCCSDGRLEQIIEQYRARESECRKKRLELLQLPDLGTPSSHHLSRAESNISRPAYWEENSEDRNKSQPMSPKNWVSQFWDPNKN